ncbi:MAG: hypothetical protein JW718_02135 [Desulfovibrionaceae bacterium]|nr:hypothetical protein [Desulfovibrionaceae bacterium]
MKQAMEHGRSGPEVAPVRGRAQLKQFIDLAWDIYQGDPNWVAPIRSELARMLDPARHPFWERAERELFVVRRAGRAVGRVAAILDRAHNEFSAERACAFGFFECRDDQDAAEALLLAVADWARARGLEFVRGPLNPSTNYETGLLVAGFDSPPGLMMPYNPDYYPRLLAGCGLSKEKDLFSYLLTRQEGIPQWMLDLSARINQRGGVVYRQADMARLPDEVRLMNRIYAECWSENWGFSPMSDQEIEEQARALKRIAVPELVMFIEVDGEPAGCFLALPDFNPLLRRLDGVLGPSALVKKWLFWKEIKGVRVLLFGVRKKYRAMGLPLAGVLRFMDLAHRFTRYDYLEAGWTLEDNDEVNTLIEDFGGRLHKRYRVYRRDL